MCVCLGGGGGGGGGSVGAQAVWRHIHTCWGLGYVLHGSVEAVGIWKGAATICLRRASHSWRLWDADSASVLAAG